jgi:TPR repeat protein
MLIAISRPNYFRIRASWVKVAVAILTWLFVSTASAGLNEGLRALRVADFQTAYREFLPLAQQGDAIAQFHIGDFYHRGVAVSIDGAEARRWFRLSADQGYARAQYALAFMLFQGIGWSCPGSVDGDGLAGQAAARCFFS